MVTAPTYLQPGGASPTPAGGAFIIPMPPTTVAATILATASMSDAVEINGRLAGIVTPAAWTAAALTFQGSVDGVTYTNIYDAAVERTIASAAVPAAESRFLSLDPSLWAAFRYIKIRSGTAAAAVAQGADRVLSLVIAG